MNYSLFNVLSISPNQIKKLFHTLSLCLFWCSGLLAQDASLLAQDASLLNCEEGTPTFTGIPLPTLCDKYPNFLCETQIGVGTPFPKSSDLSSAILSGNVCVVGNFEVDGAFTFQNAVVKINQGVSISVKPSSGWSDAGSSLSIDNSKLFACSGLWKGITLGFLSTISTSNNSEIEDAQKAISATGLCALNIQQTTFNRNQVGIELNTPFPNIFVPGPQVWIFVNNRFTCDSPINGTTNEITYAGVILKDSYLYTFQTGTNTFADIQFGIHSIGTSSYIGAQNLVFERIRNSGIYMEKGNIKLKASRFINNYNSGIHIETAYNVSIAGNCIFQLDDNVFPPSLGHWYLGVNIVNFSLSSNIDISKNHFSADFTSLDKRCTNVLIGGFGTGTSEGGVHISIIENKFHSYAYACYDLSLNMGFLSNDNIDIISNAFDTKNTIVGPLISVAIVSSFGYKSNLHIFQNTFYNTPPYINPTLGIVLVGSEGKDNYVSDNHFDENGTYLESFNTGALVANFKNTKFCANTFFNTYSAFSFGGQNSGTDFTGNIAYGCNLLTISDDSWIEDQDQKGNQWTSEFNGSPLSVVVTPQVFCEDGNFAKFSEFFVHTQQSTALSGAGFNPFHPKDLFPDNNTEWWFQEEGIPAECQDWMLIAANDDNSKIKKAVADGSFAAQFTDPSLNWQAERDLYFALKHNPSIEIGFPAQTAFRTAKQGGNIDKLYQVATYLDAARCSNPTLLANAENNRNAINNMLSLIESADQSWQSASSPAHVASAKSIKQQKLGELMQLLQNTANLQQSYKQQVEAALPGIQQINNSITPTNDLEGYEKTVNAIFIAKLQNGGITDAQRQLLQNISELCPKDGGMAVYMARSILPKCGHEDFSDDYEGCYPTPQIISRVTPRSDGNLSINNDVISVQIVPNPATEETRVIVPYGKQGTIRFFNAVGSLLFEQRIVSSQTSCSLRSFPAGIYYFDILFTDGKRECQKLVIPK